MRLVGQRGVRGGEHQGGSVRQSGLSTPRSVHELTPAWMTGALRRRFPGALVDRVQVLRVDEGANVRAKLAIHYAAGGGPAQVFVKMDSATLHPLLLFSLRALTTEARLARLELTLPLEHAELYAGAVNADHLRAVVVMEDVTARSGRPNDAKNPLDVEGVHAGLQGLARLHAAFWDRPLSPTLGFVRPWRLRPVWAPFLTANLGRALRRLRRKGLDRLVPPSLAAGALASQFRASARLTATGPQTVLHGDPHPGNTYTSPGDETGFYDWQLMRIGNWSHDVGYFLISSLDVATRRASERDLLRSYLDALDCAGVAPPRFETAFELYRAAPAYGLASWLHVYLFAGLHPVSTCLAALDRFGAAYEDLETRTASGLMLRS